jgi:hypothetical protein
LIVIGAMASLAALFLYGPRTALGVALGALLAAANLWVVGRLVRGFLASEGRGLGFVGVALVKLVALLGVVALLVASGLVAALPLAIGYGALPLSVLVAELVLLYRAGEGL